MSWFSPPIEPETSMLLLRYSDLRPSTGKRITTSNAIILNDTMVIRKLMTIFACCGSATNDKHSKWDNGTGLYIIDSSEHP